jgi:hypothetical protein
VPAQLAAEGAAPRDVQRIAGHEALLDQGELTALLDRIRAHLAE